MELAIWAMIWIVFGAMMGSFACCQVRRLRRKEEGKKKLGKWSVCEHCGKRLTFKENIPIISWLVQKGRCRKCKKKIGAAEILSEVGLAVIFGLLAYVAWREVGGWTGIWAMLTEVSEGFNWQVVLWSLKWALTFATVTSMWMIVIYDAKWGKMPSGVLVATAGMATLVRIVALVECGFVQSELINLAGALAILPLLYFLLYFFSKEQLVGSGDWLLALSVALLLGNWWLAFFELFLSNAIASIVAIGIVIKDKQKKRKKEPTKETFGKDLSLKIPFGPYLVVAYVIIMVLAPWITKLLLR